MWWFSLTALAVCALDQLTKWWALSTLVQFPGHRLAIIPGLFDLYLQFNTGGAFSLLQDRPAIIVTFATIAVIAMILYVRRLPRDAHELHFVFGLIVGGAVGNLVDRFRLRCVVDFFHVYWREWYWPTFNVADAAICVGVGMYLLLVLFHKKYAKQTPADTASRAAESSSSNANSVAPTSSNHDSH